MDTEDFAADAALFARLRATWDDIDPMPADMIDRMVAAVAVADLSREYALLTLVEGAVTGAVRTTPAETATLQFSRGDTTVLLHVSVTAAGNRRIDGWVDAETLAIRLVQGGFAFEEIPPGMTRLRMAVRGTDGAMKEFETPQFEA